ncbi:acetoacetate--CoA ligase [Marinobacterium sp. LSUCC0821]|uniref:acetoacetate--CoA ligase n=1 Tax=Marinobacterium sp. LSUCC0821 TaxID=2668067 RepID=UPI0014516331|nr:acetoacetate--CoA ligase [Marinobacterium sp. LSUCC0821]QJD70556.1 acetoacetate--CoA ligase [Marinobacterium sp. LSUCC0821]
MQPLWSPTEAQISDAQLTRFRTWLATQDPEYSFADYDSLWHWSTSDIWGFWEALRRFLAIDFTIPAHSVVDTLTDIPGANWFSGASLNFAEALLKRRDSESAVIFRGENGRRYSLSYADLYQQTAKFAHYLKAQGVVAGDRVAGYMPNIPETIVAMLATSSIGAIWTSCSPDFGANGVVDRFGQTEPKILVTVDGYHYGGKKLDNRDKLPEILERIPSVKTVVVVPFLDLDIDLSNIPKAINWNSATANDVAEVEFAQLPFDHPLYIMYSSGTTGVPKCIVHGAGGTLIQHLKEHVLHTDMSASDRMLYFTTCGWMMWNWMVSALGAGSSLVLFDGSPFHPSASALWDIIEEESVTVFGTGAKYIAAIQSNGLKPAASHDLTKLRAILSTGSPLSPESFEFIYKDVKSDLHLASISGGTDIISCFALGNPTLPVYTGEIQSRGLGMAVDIFDDEGNSMPAGKGELVCTKPFPSRPLGFWNDPEGVRYHEAYFDHFEGVWAHGDYAEITAHKGLIIHGRSDAVLNPGGVRIGTAEIYRQVEKVSEVVDSICIGQPYEDDVRVVLFVVLRDGVELDDQLIAKIKTTIRSNTTPRHVPSIIKTVADIPRTKSGKIVELAVRNVVMGAPVKNVESLANPEALDNFKNIV